MPFKSEKQRKWMHSNMPKLAKSWEKKYQQGGKLEGKLHGPSHQQGGIKFSVGGEIQEAEGGEFVVRKDSVHPGTEAVLKYINETGSVPNITDARKRRK